MISLLKVTAGNFGRFEKGIMEIETVSFLTPWTSHAFEEEARRSLSSLWVLLEEVTVVGYICFWIVADEVHLMNIAVHQKMRGRGLGNGLLDKMTESGVAQGAKSVLLEVRPSNREARGLYWKKGFREIGRRPQYYRDTGEDAILMALSLGPDLCMIDGQGAPLAENKSLNEKCGQVQS
ncbi:MAG: ribosomal protein S18-alanine N-acetyltransferase [Desulfatiglandaceae bacterium]|jgi:[ribosomal protein S18]-alanine N-acetyltransferase